MSMPRGDPAGPYTGEEIFRLIQGGKPVLGRLGPLIPLRIQRIRAVAGPNGQYAWTFPTAFRVAPLVIVTAQGTAAVPVWAEVVGEPSVSGVTVMAIKPRAITSLLITAGAEAWQPAPGAAVNIIAVEP